MVPAGVGNTPRKGVACLGRHTFSNFVMRRQIGRGTGGSGQNLGFHCTRTIVGAQWESESNDDGWDLQVTCWYGASVSI